MSSIHHTAIISPSAQIGAGCEIGPYCVIGPKTSLGKNNILKSHVVLDGKLSIGEGNSFFPFTSIGQIPQDKKYHGEDSELVIGNNNIFREYVTANLGTEAGGMKTIIGDDCLFMASSHVAHDCRIGNGVILANSVALAGHVEIGDYAIIGGLSAIHQFTRIGAYAMIGGMSGIAEDVIPCGLAMGERANLIGLNLIGLKRRNLSKQQIADLRSAFDMLFDSKSLTFHERVQQVSGSFADSEMVKQIIDFIEQAGPRTISKPKRTHIETE